ncbi:MAG: Non-canonical purine NTP pyrophosphatase [candidate division WS6 bacterium GW2011_GWC1_36_11]|uniref:Non-canonical purine NTP pyrophosphatase n=1 Tax=candidate division WS6 bacterium GW2011_GWC1_36_11 TaxID=1619090 RepID=A0A0G0DDF5_9BACT|nr:MAG: Non-canonical purine NTP pyrophosphatase [candidate division WS6 bacterium GW2011_GWC1_36_11]
MDILIGTKNPYKSSEMEYLLTGIHDVKIHFLKDTDINLNIEEDGKSLTENAEKKAIEISKHTDMYALASDGGTDIPGLGDKWDMLKNQRTVGENSTDLEKVKKLLSLMNGLKGEERKVICYLSVALAYQGNIIWSTEEMNDNGYIIDTLTSEDIPLGRWMGHVWYYPQFKEVNTKITEEQRLEIRNQEEGIKMELREVIEGLI